MSFAIDDRVRAAREALRAHDYLHRVEAIGERFPLGEHDGQPVDAAGWFAWHDEQYRPALDAWQTAMTLLALALGDQFPGRHPRQWRPVCEQLLIRADLADTVADTAGAAGAVAGLRFDPVAGTDAP